MKLRSEIEKTIADALNRESCENGSNTPDWILAEYLVDCLVAFDNAAKKRDSWYGVALRPGSVHKIVPR